MGEPKPRDQKPKPPHPHTPNLREELELLVKENGLACVVEWLRSIVEDWWSAAGEESGHAVPPSEKESKLAQAEHVLRIAANHIDRLDPIP